MLNIIKRTYDLLPKEQLKFLRYIPNRLLFGKSYGEWKNKVSFDKQLFNIHLFNTLNYARENTAYGSDTIPKSFALSEVISVLESLPIITSEDVSSNLDYFVSREFNWTSSYKTVTGGTGRSPTTVVLSNEAYGIEWAHALNFWSNAGYDRSKDLRLTLRGKSLRGDKLIEFNPIYNELVVDVYKINHTNVGQLIKEIKCYPIQFLFGYPSLVKEFMFYFQQYGYAPSLKGVLLSSEEISVSDKKLIQEYFQAKVLSSYGQTEKLAFGADIEANGRYKLYSTYGYPRIVNGEIVGTTFINRAMPLINYQTGDGAEIMEDEDSLYLINLSSRRGKDFIYLNREKKVSVTLIGIHSAIQDELLYYQIHQKEFGKIEVRILQKPTSLIPPRELAQTFKNELQSELIDFDITIINVDEKRIVKSHRGKKVLLVQELKVNP